ncbi:MAG: aromatic amino acid lyase, partial [Gaiellaceae bacterium]
MTVLLAGRADVTLDAFERVAWGGEDVELAPAALERMAACRQEFLALLESEPTLSVYGVTTGTGERAGQGLAAAAQLEEATRAPVNGSSFGEPLPERVVRGIVLARLTGFVEGNAAVRPELALAVAGLLGGPLPEVPARGNAGSGEILALGHLFNGIGIPLELKEPIALVNGSPCAAALVADGALLARRRLPRAEQVFALAVEAIAAPLGAF